MSFSFVGVSGDGAAVVVNSDELPQPPHSTAPHNFTTQQLDTMSTIVPFSSFLNPLASFSSSFGGFSTITTAPGFSTFSNPSWNPYAPMADPPPVEDTTKKRYFEPTPVSLATAAARKKRKQNFFEEEEATCAKCHYRRKCMKCINCFARFCEQRCLPRYLEDPAAQEEVKLTNTWLCPCCKGIEPPGKYKGSDISRKDVEDSKEKDGEDDDDAKPSTSSLSSSSNVTQQIVPQQSPIQAHVTPTNSHTNSYFLDHQSQNPFSQFQQQNQLQMQQLQIQQQMKLQQLQQQQQQYQLQQQLLQQQFPSQFSSPAQLQVPPQRSSNPQLAQMYAFPLQSPNTTPQNKLPPGLGGEPGSEISQPESPGQTKEKKSKGANGIATNGGAIAVPGEGNPDEYPKETEDFCSVCGDIYSYDDNNEIIYCDGCNVAVHQACYGVSKIPAGEWLCDRCKSKVLPECFLCSQKGGAMKELVDLPGRWVHVTCVATLYELRPLDYSHKIGPPGIVDKIDKRRYHLKCATCKERNAKNITGPLVQCKSKRCTQAFHPICCKKKLIYCKDLGIFVTYCQKHANEAPQTS